MKVELRPSLGTGTMQAPPSKSVAHRLLIGGALSQGQSILDGISHSQDMLATLDCLTALGATVTRSGDQVTLGSFDPFALPDDAVLPCRESGSTLRFFIPLCLLSGKPVTFTGSEKLLSRPLDLYADICKKQGLLFEQGETTLRVCGKLQSGVYKMKGNISSQFITGLLFALPLLEGDSTIALIPPIESCSYINLTIQALSTCGIEVLWLDERTLFVPGSQTYQPIDTAVEGDYSGAAFFAALNRLGSSITLTGLNPDSLQGDKIYEKYFALLGRGTPTIHIADCPDLGPILFALSALFGGGVFTGTRRLKLKESDRAAAMAQELAKCGVAVTLHEDSVVIYPHDLHAPTQELYGHNDHRIVMSLAVLATRLGGVIDGAQAAAKSMPDFFDRLEQLGFEVTRHDA